MRTQSIRSQLIIRWMVVGCAVALWLLQASPTSATLVVNEPFNTDTATTATTLATYPAFTLNNGTTATVNSGILNLTSTVGGGNSFTVNAAPLPSKFLVRTDLGGTGATVSTGSDAVGLRVGNYAFVFFPNFPNGALQIRTVAGSGAPNGVAVPDQSITFTPALDVLHHMEVGVDGQNFTIKITNGNAPFQTGTILFTPSGVGPQPAFVLGPIGLTNLNNLTGIYDNFVIDDLIFVPEPSTLSLLGLGIVGLAIKRRRRQSA